MGCSVPDTDDDEIKPKGQPGRSGQPGRPARHDQTTSCGESGDESDSSVWSNDSTQTVGSTVANKLEKKTFPQEANQYNKTAAGIIMQTMYGARMARPDLLRCVGHLATYLTKWTRAEDEKLHRMMAYIKKTLPYRQIGYIGDHPDELKLGLFVDSDLAGDRRDCKSTSGNFIAFDRSSHVFPPGGVCKEADCSLSFEPGS